MKIKFVTLFVSIFFFIQCDIKKTKPKAERDVPMSQTKLFNERTMDTTGCWRMILGRYLYDSLTDESAYVETNNTDTFLMTKKYKRLLICNLSKIPLLPEDSFSITGYIYSIAGDERIYGYPTMLTKIGFFSGR